MAGIDPYYADPVYMALFGLTGMDTETATLITSIKRSGFVLHKSPSRPLSELYLPVSMSRLI